MKIKKDTFKDEISISYRLKLLKTINMLHLMSQSLQGQRLSDTIMW